MSSKAFNRLVVWHVDLAETLLESGGSCEHNRQPGVCWIALRNAVMTTFFCIFGSAIFAEEDSYTEGEKLFALRVKPLLEQKCFACHGGTEKTEGDLILTSRKEMLLGGESSDEVLVPGNGNGSLIYQSTTRNTEECQMPPKEVDKLTEAQTWHIRDWIDAGAPWPSDEDQAIIRAVRHDILEFSARVLAPHRPQRTQFHPID